MAVQRAAYGPHPRGCKRRGGGDEVSAQNAISARRWGNATRRQPGHHLRNPPCSEPAFSALPQSSNPRRRKQQQNTFGGRMCMAPHRSPPDGARTIPSPWTFRQHVALVRPLVRRHRVRRRRSSRKRTAMISSRHPPLRSSRSRLPLPRRGDRSRRRNSISPAIAGLRRLEGARARQLAAIRLAATIEAEAPATRRRAGAADALHRLWRVRPRRPDLPPRRARPFPPGLGRVGAELEAPSRRPRQARAPPNMPTSRRSS